MRWYEMRCLRGTSATYCRFECWAMNCVDAFEQAKANGCWPVALLSSSFERVIICGEEAKEKADV